MPVHDARSVLVVSHEPSLQDTYRLLFYSVGYVTHAVDADEVCSTLKGTAFTVVVLDHTLTKQERKAAVQYVREFSPETKALALHNSGKDCGADLTLDSREGPKAVLEAVERLTNGVGWSRSK
jgi:CheY-like chemotaxis protein